MCADVISLMAERSFLVISPEKTKVHLIKMKILTIFIVLLLIVSTYGQDQKLLAQKTYGKEDKIFYSEGDIIEMVKEYQGNAKTVELIKYWTQHTWRSTRLNVVYGDAAMKILDMKQFDMRNVMDTILLKHDTAKDEVKRMEKAFSIIAMQCVQCLEGADWDKIKKTRDEYESFRRFLERTNMDKLITPWFSLTYAYLEKLNKPNCALEIMALGYCFDFPEAIEFADTLNNYPDYVKNNWNLIVRNKKREWIEHGYFLTKNARRVSDKPDHLEYLLMTKAYADSDSQLEATCELLRNRSLLSEIKVDISYKYAIMSRLESCLTSAKTAKLANAADFQCLLIDVYRAISTLQHANELAKQIKDNDNLTPEARAHFQDIAIGDNPSDPFR